MTRMMGRLPFDPDRVELPKTPVRTDADRPMTVSEVAGLIRDAVAAAAANKIRVVGEVSNFSQRSHWFFSLKDEAATLRCVCFASAARRIRAPVANGMEVVATGRLDFYDAQGHVQLYVDKIEPVGEGALELRFRALCDELRTLGYFDPQTKLPTPQFARRIAVVTSRSAAALQDVIDTRNRRWPGCELLLVDVRVQGDRAAAQIADAISVLSRDSQQLGLDAILLTRGGGSIEDLWAFNERVVADAIHRCPLPIVAAIGHETDTTIAELVADARCATPTQAAMTLVPDADALRMQIDQYTLRLTQMLRRRVEHDRQRADAVARHPLFRRPLAMIDEARDRIDRTAADLARSTRDRIGAGRAGLAEHRHALASVEPRSRLMLARRRYGEAASLLLAAARRRLDERRVAIDALARQLASIGPASVLNRGFSYTLDRDRKPLRSVAGVEHGDRITTVLADGKLQSTVTGASKPLRAARRKPRIDKPLPDQLDLFGGRDG